MTKQRVKKMLSYVVLLLTIVGAYRLRQSGRGLGDLLASMRQIISSGLLGVLGIIQRSVGLVEQRISK